ncbi:MAG: hypothetical protein M1837_006582 [Sclerophora amabilis]|nr:MAG: hypothetical protein M1837_006582 [Sclerophora amabilis]
MSQELKNVALLGAGGNLGVPVLDALLESGQFNVTVLSRASSTSTFPSQVKVIKSDYSEASLVEAFTGQDAVISTLTTTAVDAQTAIVNAAATAGVKRFIPSEFGNNTLNKEAVDLVPILREKQNIQEIVKAKVTENPGFSYTNISTGAFFDWGLKTGFLGFDLQSKKATIWDDGERLFSANTLSSIARAVVSVLLHPTETKNQHIFISSFELNQNQLLKAVEAATGEKWTVERVATDAKIQEGNDLLKQGNYLGNFTLVLAATYDKRPFGSNFAKEETLSNELLGLPRLDLDQTVKAIVNGETV